MVSDLPTVPQGLLDRVSPKSNEQQEEFHVEQNSNMVEKSLPPHCIVTQAFIQNAVHLLYKQENESFLELIDILLEEDIEDVSFSIKDSMKNWAENNLSSLALPESITEEECKALFHGIYLFFSELIGPMDADNIVNNALQQTLSVDEVSRFHPRQLL